MSNVTNSILNFSCFTLFETAFLTIMTYMLMSRFDLLDVHRIKNTIKTFLVPVLVLSLLYNLLFLFIDENIVKIIYLISLYFTLLYILSKDNFQKSKFYFLKVLGSFVGGCFIMVFVETICMFSIIGILNQPIDVIQTDMKIKIITSIPLRFVEFFAILIMYANRSKKYMRLHQIILKNKKILIISIIFISATILDIIHFIKLVLFNNIFYNTKILEQLFSVSFRILIIPSVFISTMFIIIMFLIDKEKELQQLYKNTN